MRLNNFLYKKISKRTRKSYESAIQWLKNNLITNIQVSSGSKQETLYNGIRGIIIPTLYKWGEKKLARELSSQLIYNQNENGSFSGKDGYPSLFVTGQVLRGLLKSLDDVPDAKNSVINSCNWILKQIDNDGRFITHSSPSEKIYDNKNIYVLPPLYKAGIKLNNSEYIQAANKVLKYYKSKEDLVSLNMLSQFNGYVWDALYDLGEKKLVLELMQNVVDLQGKNGAIPEYHDNRLSYLIYMAQIALIGYKLGMIDFSGKIINFLIKNQNKNGGFFGVSNNGNMEEKVIQCVKYYLDAYYWKQKTSFNLVVTDFPNYIEEGDGRLLTILEFFGDLNNKKVIDIGCGKGRYLRVLDSKFSNAELYGVDISEEMLLHCPEKAITQSGTLLNIGYPDEYFDFVYCVEALEHALRIEPAVKEITRILKKEGKIIVIDKNVNKLGKKKLESWENWFEPEKLLNILKENNIEIDFKPITYDNHSKPDGLFYAWFGKKLSLLLLLLKFYNWGIEQSEFSEMLLSIC
jgi:malonyl-CoA O-methyltransferase